MINIERAKGKFYKYLEKYDDKEQAGFQLKVTHTMYVVDNAKDIATKLNLSDEDIELAQLIALLHDIGRFEELNFFKQFASVKFDHALYGVEILFQDNLIRKFILEDTYDNIIKEAIFNHNKLSISNNLDNKQELHAKIIRDADILDNYRVKRDEDIENIFPGLVKDISDLENSTISDKVLECILNKSSIDIRDRVTPLDYWVCVLGFVFNLSFNESLQIVRDNNYINVLIDRIKYNNIDTKNKMELIRNTINNYVGKNDY